MEGSVNEMGKRRIPAARYFNTKLARMVEDAKRSTKAPTETKDNESTYSTDN